jgi:hypothetical protein
MGLEFATQTAQQGSETENFIHFLSTQPGLQPQLLVSPQKPVSDDEPFPAESDDIDDPLLDLLRNHESFSEEIFIETLRSQRKAEFVESEQ